jgi:aurora kinase A-interacting protein
VVPPPTVTITNQPWISQKIVKIEIPLIPLITKIQIDLPNYVKNITPLQEPCQTDGFELPTTTDLAIPKQAERMIVIRRNKMKRHKLKKLRKRMKFEWAKRRQKREWNKEKAFQAELIQQCKKGEEFSAEKYVEERLSKLNEVTMQKSKKNKSLTNDCT